MTKVEAIKALRSVLADLYADVDETKRVVQDAGLSLSYIKFGGSSINNWYNILNEADKRMKLPDLLVAADAEFGQRPEFQTAYQAYLTAIGRVGSKIRPVKLLLLAANPVDTGSLKLAEEMRTIIESLRKTPFYEHFTPVQASAVRYTDLQGLLLEYKPDIVHFSGHGSDAGELKLQDETGISHPVSASALTQLFTVLKQNIRCVVLNACYTDIQGKAIAEQIDAVIGMSNALGDEAAIDFAAGFYEALGHGADVKRAFDLGRNRINLAGWNDEDLPQLLPSKTDLTKLVFAGG